MITWMNTRLFHIKVWVLFHRYSFFCIISSNIFKNFGLTKRISFFIETCQPKTRSLSVEIICYAKIVFSDFQDQAARFTIIVSYFLFLHFLFCKHIVTIVIIIIDVVEVEDAVATLSWLIIIVIYNLHSTITNIIQIKGLSLSLLLWIYSFNPSIIGVSL